MLISTGTNPFLLKVKIHYFSVSMLLLALYSYAGDISIGLQNGIGQSFEQGRQTVNPLWAYRGSIYTITS
jgi:hypothetical protein